MSGRVLCTLPVLLDGTGDAHAQCFAFAFSFLFLSPNPSFPPPISPSSLAAKLEPNYTRR